MSNILKKNPHLKHALLTFALSVAALGAASSMAVAEDSTKPVQTPMDHSKMPGMDHSNMPGMDHANMAGMHSNNMHMSMTGDVDYDFAANMRQHHKMAVEMSQTQLAKGKNAQMKQLAKDVIAAQNKEIAILDKWLSTHKAKSK